MAIGHDGATQESRVEQPVSRLELFFDLVFVFGITQVTGYLGAELTWLRFAQGLAVLAVLWWAWVAYAWVANAAGTDDGPARVVLLAAMAAMLIVSLAVPDAFGDSALWFAAALLLVRLLHLGLYLVISRDDPGLRRIVRRLAVPLSIGPILLVAGAVAHDEMRAACWIAALLIDYSGPIRGAGQGSRVHPGHFAERFGLIIIIALGESIIAIGIGAEGLELDAWLAGAALLGIAVSAALWWAYFDIVAIVAEHHFRAAPPLEQVRIARDSYMYIHTLMIAGVIVFALGVKKTIAHVHDPLETIPAVALAGGPALFLAALVLFRLRTMRSWNYARVVAVVALMALIPVFSYISALASLACVAIVTVALVTWETQRYAQERSGIRGEH